MFALHSCHDNHRTVPKHTVDHAAGLLFFAVVELTDQLGRRFKGALLVGFLFWTAEPVGLIGMVS